MTGRKQLPDHIQVRGAKVHNLKNIDVDIPLNAITAIAGVSGSGKSSLALGVLYAEGSRRYLESLSTYTRRRMTQASKAAVEEVLYVPAALALHQRPGVPDIRSTFGTGTEILNNLRLMFSRLASHQCPNGHYVPPTIRVASEQQIVCPECGEKFFGPGAEELAFNSSGACPACEGTGVVTIVDESTLVPDDSLSIDEGAVAPWQTLMWSLMKDIARKQGVRTDVPFRELTEQEKEIVFYGPAEKHHIVYQNQKSGESGEMDFTYFNAIYTVTNALSRVKDEKGMKRVARFVKQDVCPDCHGTRLSKEARTPLIKGISLDQACRMTLTELIAWVKTVPDSLPEEMVPMAENIIISLLDTANRLEELGLGYLTIDRAASTLSTGERQRMQFARSVRNRTTGVLYLLDEPSIGLHPSNQEGLREVMEDLVADGNSVILVDHDTNILKHADHMIEMGPGAGENGGRIIAQGSIEEIGNNPKSIIGAYLTNRAKVIDSPKISKKDLFSLGTIHMETESIHTVKPLTIDLPKGRLIVVSGVSGSGKTTMVLESLIPALQAGINGTKLPDHVRTIQAEGIRQVKLIDSTPIGINVRSTVATYANVHNELRKAFARTPEAKQRSLKAGDFSYNTGSLRCKTCDGTGSISLDIQFLPDVDIPCPDCRGSRYDLEASLVTRENKKTTKRFSIPSLMEQSVDRALAACSDLPVVSKRLQVLEELGLGYLTLGEQTPALSGGEAQRLKLASELGKGQEDSVFVFDEPTIGLHPQDVQTLLKVFRTLIDHGATVIVIEHDIDVIRNADYCIDMGPEGGEAGGRIVACGTPEDLRACKDSKTGQYL